MSVDECLNSYSDMAEKVFGKPRWASWRFSPLFWPRAKYSGTRLKDVVKQVVEDHLCEGEGHCFAMNKEMCRTVAVAYKKNERGVETAHLFKTYDHHRRRRTPVVPAEERNPNPMEKVGPADCSLIWQVARATSAAPMYFDTIQIGEDEYSDGGFGENNPSYLMYFEVSQMNRNMHNANELSLSIGTGITRFSRFQNGLFKRPIAWFNAAKKISTDCEKTHDQMQKLTNFGRTRKYYRFNVPENATDPDANQPSRWKHLSDGTKKWFGHGNKPLDRGLGKIKLDEWKSKGFWRSESTKDEIERITKEYLRDETVNKELDEVAKFMVTHRRARSKTPRWRIYALGIRYECPVAQEICPDETWMEESALSRHLVEDHEFDFRRLDQEIQAGEYFEYHH